MRGVFCDEPITVGCVAKRFGAAAARRRKRSGHISKRETIFKFCAADELMQKSGVETIAGANRIDNFDGKR